MGHDPAAAARWFRSGFSHGYDPDALGNYAVSLARVGALDDAECVFVESLYHGPDAGSAATNYAVFLATNPGRASQYPGAAAATVDRVLQGPFPAELASALRERPRSPPTEPPTPWPRGSCPGLSPAQR